MTHDEESEPAELRHCRQVYAKMASTAKEQTGAEGTMLVFEGFTTRLVADLGLSVPYYTKIYRNLKSMGCVRQLQRGGSSTPSQWWLIEEPTAELWEAKRSHHGNSKVDLLTNRVNDIDSRLAALERLLAQGVEIKEGKVDQT